jgi:hypothetical protein
MQNHIFNFVIYIKSEYFQTDMMLPRDLALGTQGVPCIVTSVVNFRDEKSLSLSLSLLRIAIQFYTKPLVSNLICYCEFTKYLFYNSHFGSDNISALP